MIEAPRVAFDIGRAFTDIIVVTGGRRLRAFKIQSLRLRPAFHVFVGSKASWFEIADQLPRFDVFPPASLVREDGSSSDSQLPGGRSIGSAHAMKILLRWQIERSRVGAARKTR